jgi:hypothetical protein
VQTLDPDRDDVLRKAAGKPLIEKELQIGDYPGRETHWDAGEGNLLRTRSFLVGRRLHQVGVRGPKEFVLSNVADQFLDSFQPLRK